MKEKYKYILGLDIGISSVGWGLIEIDEEGNPYRIIDVGSRIFPPGEVEKTGESRAKERREKRSSRRLIRRREFRVDRVRNLLFENYYLNGEVTSNIVSVKNEELTKIYDDMINNYYKNNAINPYILKTKALDKKLTNDELSIILVHYAKKRGYKSNREDKADNDTGKVKEAIEENREIIKNNHYRTVSEMYTKDEKFKNKIKNSPNDYKLSVTNEMYLDEINKVLDKQISFGLIDKNFKEEYLKIYNGRRHYSNGPGFYYEYDKNGKKQTKQSKYGGNLIEKMIGKCSIDGKPRAPKRAPSSEIFTALTIITNLRYKTLESNYTKLSEDEIKNIIELAKTKNSLTYGNVVKILNKDDVVFKNLQLTKKKYGDVILKLKKELKIDKDEKISINELNEEDRSKFNQLYKSELYNTKLIELKGYHDLRKKITTSFGKDEWINVKDNIDMLDELALYCTNYKIDDEILKAIKNSDLIDDKYVDTDFVNSLPNFKDHMRLSTNVINSLIPLMLDGKGYDEAMKELYGTHTDFAKDIEKSDLLVPVNVDENITNQRVIRSLTQARKVINSIIKKYGLPKEINIETARELAKSRKERNEIEKIQNQNRENNETIKEKLVELGLFNSIDRINSFDLLKYKLWEEQNELCGYSMKKIEITQLYTNDVQVDHILPYSRTFNDNYLNKTLVLTKENQDKGNRTPYEWFGNTEKWQEYENYINSLNISTRKKDNYLLRKLDFDTEREMRNQNLNDTKYISRELSSLLKTYLNVEGVNMYPGAITAKLRARWGFNRLTHSYISKTYIMPDDMKRNITKDRDNHLHHAMDALVIASITKSLERKVLLYERYNKYIDGMVKNQLLNMNITEKDNQLFDQDGVLIESNLKDYIKHEISEEHIKYGKHDIAKLDFPTPYEKFVEEAKLRVYEQDENVLKNELEKLGTYTKKEIEKTHTLTPSIAKPKVSGAMHKDTYYGIKTIETDNEKITYKTIRKPLEKITLKDIDSIPDKDNGSKAIYKAIKEWLGGCNNGAEALKIHDGKYPVIPNDKDNKEIKRIKVYTEYNNNGHIIIKNNINKENKVNVEKGGIYRINIYKSIDDKDDKLYFVPLDIFDIESIKLNKKNIPLKMDFGRGKNNLVLPYNKINEKYQLYKVLNKNDLVRIILKDGRTSIGYIVGATSGKLEIKSKIGDGYDLIGDGKIFSTIHKQFEITISTIERIDKLSINILGEVNELQTSGN